jgi:hypothetical protein
MLALDAKGTDRSDDLRRPTVVGDLVRFPRSII